MEKSKKTVILCVMHHREKPSESTKKSDVVEIKYCTCDSDFNSLSFKYEYIL
jgi:hypothetical protein